MCAPLAALAAVASIGSAVTNFAAKQQEYDAKSAAWRQNVVNAQAAARDDQKSLLTRQLQEGDKNVQDKHISYMEGAQKSAMAIVSGAAGGVSGISVDNLVSDIQGKSALNRTYADTNYQYKAADLQNKLTGTVTTMQSRIDSMPKPSSPSPLALGFQIAGAGVNYAKGMST